MHLFFVLLTVAVASAQSLDLIVSNSTLPMGNAHMASAYDGDDSIYIWGGDSFYGDPTILKYSLSTESVEALGFKMEAELGSGVMTGNGTLLYIGGRSFSQGEYVLHSNVWSFQLEESTEWTSVANLPVELFHTNTVCDGGDNTYVIGGRSWDGAGMTISKTISKYNSRTHSLEEAAQLPYENFLTSAVWDNSSGSLYIFGGFTPVVGYTTDILRFTPSDRSVTKVEAALPLPSGYSCAVWTGKAAYIIGGFTHVDQTPHLVRFDPVTNEVKEVPVNNFPEILYGVTCTYVEKFNRIYVFGGDTHTQLRDEIRYIDLDTEL